MNLFMSFTTSFNDNSDLQLNMSFSSIGCADGVRGASEKAALAEDRPKLSQMDAVRHAPTASAATFEISADLKVVNVF